MLLRIRQISIQKKIVLCGLVLFLLGLCAVFLMPQERMRNTNAALRIGAGDDISGYLLERVLEQDPSLIADSSADIEAYTFQDC